MPKKTENSTKAPAARAVAKPAVSAKARAIRPAAAPTEAVLVAAKPGEAVKKAAPASLAEKPAALVAPTPVVAKSTPKPAAKKAVAPKKSVSAASTLPPPSTLTNEEIGLRAYFISERRQIEGYPGDSSSDWIAAECELIAECASAARTSKSK